MYMNWCHGNTKEDILESFQYSEWERGQGGEPTITPPDMEVIVAFYEYENYSGNAFLVYRDLRDGKVYEVNGGHCSCFGLEGQWSPEEVVVKELLNRPEYVSSWVNLEEGRNDQILAALVAALG